MKRLRPLIKFIGNKSRFAEHICSNFPSDLGTYYEPFVGSGAVLGCLAPKRAVASDVIKPLVDMWKLVQKKPKELVYSYAENYEKYVKDWQVYEEVKARFNKSPNPHDFLFVSRTCYGGVIRFRKDGYLSTPIGPHKPISPAEFERRALEWQQAVKNTEFVCCDYADTVQGVKRGDVVYCDPPYVDSQKIIYGAQGFTLTRLFTDLENLKKRGAFVALSIDGIKKSGKRPIEIEPPKGLFEEESYVSLGGSMLKRFWRIGTHVRDEHVKDRLLLSERPSQLTFLSAVGA